MANAFIKQVVTREAEFNDQYVVQGGPPEEFEHQKGRLLAARDKADRIEVMMAKLSRMAPAIKVIDDEQIPVEGGRSARTCLVPDLVPRRSNSIAGIRDSIQETLCGALIGSA